MDSSGAGPALARAWVVELNALSRNGHPVVAGVVSNMAVRKLAHRAHHLTAGTLLTLANEQSGA